MQNFQKKINHFFDIISTKKNIINKKINRNLCVLYTKLTEKKTLKYKHTFKKRK